MYKTTLLPSVEEIKSICPLSAELQKRKESFDHALATNMRERTNFTVVCGPCSADDPKAVELYCQKLAELQKQYPNLLLVARVYTTKPHSNGQGYKGLCFGGGANMQSGIVECRKMMMRVMELGLPVADELLYPELYPYFSDLVSYWFVGARSSEDSLHRGVASMLDTPCGIKNSTNGLVETAVQNLQAVANPCVFPFSGNQVETAGNSLAHVVLRGGVAQNGYFCNIKKSYTAAAKKLLRKLNLNDFLLADLSHANSGKVATNQITNAKIVSADKNVDGAMMESYLYGGTDCDAFGVSKTDACVGWDDTVNILTILHNGFCNRK